MWCRYRPSRCPAGAGKGYLGVNYLIQGNAYDLLAEAIDATHAAGLDGALCVAVHDELVVRTDVAEDVRRIMTTPPQALVAMAGRTRCSASAAPAWDQLEREGGGLTREFKPIFGMSDDQTITKTGTGGGEAGYAVVPVAPGDKGSLCVLNSLEPRSVAPDHRCRVYEAMTDPVRTKPVFDRVTRDAPKFYGELLP